MASIIKAKLGVEIKCVKLTDSNQREINRDTLDELINNFLTTPYKPEDRGSLQYLEKCWFLFKQDYEIGQVHNQDGSLCAHYPPTILIPEGEKLKTTKPEGTCEFDTSLDHRRKSESVIENSTKCMMMCEETVPRQLLGWVHVETMGENDCTKSLDIDDYGSYAFIENSKYESQKNGKSISDSEQKVNNAVRLTQLFLTARFARARSRFAVPVLIYKNKNLCRGATLSVGVEQFGRRGWDFFSTGGVGVEGDGATNLPDKSRLGRQEQLCDKVRGQDIKLLKELRVRLICDLMYQQKKLKFMMPVASSEKIDKVGRYREFLLASLPYPGCESFRGYQSHELNSDKLRFNWKVEKVDAVLNIPDGVVHMPLGVNWAEYKEWSIKDMTSCYIRLLLYQLENFNGGVFIHCISGWDRTPMFISLLRLSLWADGLAHVSLNPLEMLFFTVAYDWRLFGHKLSERNSKSEEIFYFGLDYLQHMTESEFSIHCGLQKADKCQDLVKVRRERLLEVRRLFIDSYHKFVIPKSIKFSHIS